MARKQNDDLLIEDELAAAFLNDDDLAQQDNTNANDGNAQGGAAQSDDANWDDAEEDFPGQLAVDVYETDDKLVVKARTAGVNKEDLDVSISDGILTVSGTLSSGDDTDATNWHIQECYWGEFSRTVALPVPVKEDEVEAMLKDGVLTITFGKARTSQEDYRSVIRVKNKK
jgi:HSP20 family protein